MNKLAGRIAYADAYEEAMVKVAEELSFEESDMDYPRRGDTRKAVTVTGKARGIGGLRSSDEYAVFVRRNARLGGDGKPVKGWTHPDSPTDGGSGPFELHRNEQELQGQLRSYGRYLQSIGRGSRSGWGSTKHIDRIGGGYEGSDFLYRDPLPSNSYSLKVVRREGDSGRITPAEREYASRLNDYWNYLQSAHDVTSRANRKWNDALERGLKNVEVERKG